jgi:endo-1,4-beta-xylanase
MKFHFPGSLRRSALAALLALGALLVSSSAQPENPATRQDGRPREGANQQRPGRQQEAKWLMPPVEGPNLHYKTFDSQAAGEKVSYLLYLPPGYEKNPDRRYPVVYWLHGIGGNQTGMPKFCERVTQAIEAGKAPPMIFVMANGMVDSFYCDALNAPRPVETVIIKELIPHIDATWRTLASREGRMIEGFSMGGFGAARLGFKYPDLFGSISIIDGALLGLDTIKQRHRVQFDRIFAGSDEKFTAASPFTLAEAKADQVRGRTAIRMEVGALVGPNAGFHELLGRLKVEHGYQVHEGAGHNHGVIFDRLGDKAWEFYRSAFASAAPASEKK